MHEEDSSAGERAVEFFAAYPAGHAVVPHLRDQLDIDSMDFLNFLIALHQEFGVDVPESDAGKLGSIDACVGYLEQALRQRAQA